MERYMILRDVTPVLIQATMNLWFEKGYRLNQFFVESEPMHVYIAVMEHPKVTPKAESV